jgi:hypothetical protein
MENQTKNFENVCHNCLGPECDVKTCSIRVKALEQKRLENECAQFRRDLAAWPA